eukprot:g6721.t1
MASGRSTDKSSEDSTSGEICDIGTPGPSSISTASEIKAQKDFLVHKVTKFDTLAGLAVRYGVSVFDIKKANGLTSDWSIYGKESIIIPLQTTSDDKQGDDVTLMDEFVHLAGRPMTVEGSSSSLQSSRTNQIPQGTRVQKLITISGGTERSLTYIVDNSIISSSEIELEVLRREATSSQKDDVYRRKRRDDPSWSSSATMTTSLLDPSTSSEGKMSKPFADKNSSSTLTDYFSTMAQSLMKHSENFFGFHTKWTSSESTESIFDKMKKKMVVSSQKTTTASAELKGQSGVGNKSSEPNLSTTKDLSKVD